MLPRMTTAEVFEKAAHFKALRVEEVWLEGDVADLPWSLATKCKPGGSHRLDIATTIWFYAENPNGLGLTLRWSFEIERKGANGSGRYWVDDDGCRAVADGLVGAAKRQFMEHLLSCADKVQKRASEFWEAAADQAYSATVLRKLGSTAETNMLWPRGDAIV